MDKKTVALEKKGALLKKKGNPFTDPDINSMFDPSGLPGLPDHDDLNLEQSSNVEVDDMMASIRENRKNNAEHFRDYESGEFWFCVCFQSRSQKEQFLEKLLNKYSPNNQSFGDKYVSGLELAAMLDIPVEPIILESKKSRLAPKAMRDMEVI
jgi:hypothetical protein